MTQHAIAELIENAGDSIDGVWSPMTAAIKQDLGCERLDLNSHWALTPQDWRCPACTRTKREIARVLPQGVIMMHLHLHHDHFDEFFTDEIDDLMLEESLYNLAQMFIGPFNKAFVWFRPTIVCEDCNALDGAAKNRGKTDRFFSLPPGEIRRVGHVRPNRAHFLDETLLEMTLTRLVDLHESRKGVAYCLINQVTRPPEFRTPVPIVDTYEANRILSDFKNRQAFLEYSLANGAHGMSLKRKKRSAR